MGQTIDIGGLTYEVHSCITCGVVYTAPENLMNKQREQGGFHHCINGHSQGWTKEKSEIEKLRRERDRLKQDIARAEDEAREARTETYKERKKIARLTKRSAAGVCPCCTRTVRQLALHMKTKHPEFVRQNVVPLKQRA